MMSSKFGRVLVIIGLALGAVTNCFAQLSWDFLCVDPESETFGRSDDYQTAWLWNELFRVTVGLEGTITYQGERCYITDSNITANLSGRIGFAIGETGSIQTSEDDNLLLTFGMPFSPAGSWGYAMLIVDEQKNLFGGGGLDGWLSGGLSDRYIIAQDIIGDVFVNLRIDLVGDAARFQWDCENIGNTSHDLGLWFGQMVSMLKPATGEISGFNWLSGFSQFIYVPGSRPVSINKRLNRFENGLTFPEYVHFDFGQSTAYGLRIENGPTDDTKDETGVSDATQADEIVIGSAQLLLDAPEAEATFPDNEIPDIDISHDVSFIQKFGEQTTLSGQTRTFIHYCRGTWSKSNYAKPYAVVCDAPRLVNPETSGLNGLDQSLAEPLVMRVYIDNVRGFSTAEQQIPLNNVRIKLTLGDGLNLIAGESSEKEIPVVEPRKDYSDDELLDFVEFRFLADGVVSGPIPYTIEVSPVPGPNKTVEGTIFISTTPRLLLRENANLVGVPYSFDDSSWEAILGLSSPADFQAFNWDPEQNGYVIANSAQRGVGTWIVSNADLGSHQMQSNPTPPPSGDLEFGGPLSQLKQGWNLIANIYHYPFQLGEIVGVSGAVPTQTFTWENLVNQHLVAGSLAYWDQATQSYKFISGNDATLDPNKGYWLFVTTPQELTLRYPPIFLELVPNISAPIYDRSEGDAWIQGENHWRLQVVARTATSLDDQNYVGSVSSSSEVTRSTIYEPPMAPTQKVAVSFENPAGVNLTRVAQALSDNSGRTEYKMYVQTTDEGEVALTWPNMSTVPNNLQFRLVDSATGVTRDMRRTSGYTFESQGAGTREFVIQVEPGTAGRAVIGNVIVTRPSRDPLAPFSINYTLSGSATTTIRVLASNGKEVFTITRGRADSAGENTAVWTLKDNANRSVAPGTYRVEIIAETESGERVRKIVPINVVR